MTPLFRPEAVEARRQEWLGDVRLVRPVSLSVLVAVLTFTGIAAAAWLFIGEYTRKAHVAGLLVPDRGWIRLVSPQVATVAERRVAQGQQVRAVPATNPQGNRWNEWTRLTRTRLAPPT